MADEQVSLLIDVKIEAEAALKRNVELKQSLNGLRAEQEQLKKANDTASEQYVKNEAQIKSLTAQYNANTRVLQSQANATTEASGAYATLNRAAADAALKAKDLSVAYGANDVRAKEAAKSAKAMSDQLKEVDSSVGQNQRRVGDYAGELGRLPGAMGGVANGVSGLKTGFSALSATPLLGVLQILMVVFGALSKAMGGGSDASLKLKQVMAPLTTLFEGFQVVLSDVVGWLAKGVGVITNFISKALDFIPAVNKMNAATQKSIDLEKERQKIAEENRSEIVNDAKEEARIADLKNKIAQKDKYTNKERLAFAREADKIAKEMMVDDVNRAIRTYNLKINQMKAEGKQYKDLTTEQREELKQSEAEMYRVRTEYSTSTKKLKATEATLIEEINAEASDRQNKRTAEAEKAAAKADEKRATNEADALARSQAYNDEQLRIYAERVEAQKQMAITAMDELEKALKEDQSFSDKSVEDINTYLKELATVRQGLKDMEWNAEIENERTRLEQEHKMRVDAAIAVGGSTVEIEKLYAKEKEQLEKKSTAAKLDLASGFASNIAEIFGKQSKVGKAAASAAIAIDTVKGAMAAYNSLVGIPVVGIPLGVAAAAAVAMKGARAIKDVWAVKSGLPGDSGSGGASVPSMGGGGGSAAAAITGGLASRASGEVQKTATSQAVQEANKLSPQKTVLVTNDLTTAMNEKVTLQTNNSI